MVDKDSVDWYVKGNKNLQKTKDLYSGGLEFCSYHFWLAFLTAVGDQ